MEYKPEVKQIYAEQRPNHGLQPLPTCKGKGDNPSKKLVQRVEELEEKLKKEQEHSKML